jgi:hypothetical protein
MNMQNLNTTLNVLDEDLDTLVAMDGGPWCDLFGLWFASFS